MCAGEEGDASTPIRAGASYGYVRSDLLFGDGGRTPFDKHAVVATLELPLASRSVLSGGLGAVVAGRIVSQGISHEIGPGWIATAGVSYRLVDALGARPFVLLGLTAGASDAKTRSPFGDASLFAFDLRASITSGFAFGPFRPYLSARAFGGPVVFPFGGGKSGGDAYHVQPAAGFALVFGETFTFFAEGAPVFERAIVAGVSIAL